MEAAERNHVWITNSGQGGAPAFRPNRAMFHEPLMHAICRHCSRRTWFTEIEWWNLPLGTKSERPL